MSGIYIPGMEMPTSCRACQFATRFFDGEDVCPLLGTYISDNSRDDDCPLIPVPDHGRLIDADAFESELWKILYCAKQALKSAPTIIPASGGKENE